MKKAADELASLRDESRPKGLELRSTSEVHATDGKVSLELVDPFDEILIPIHDYLQRTADLGDQADGQPSGFQFYLLSDLVQRFSPHLSVPDQKAVCHDLFDEVRERNEGSFGGYDDMLYRIAENRKTSLKA